MSSKLRSIAMAAILTGAACFGAHAAGAGESATDTATDTATGAATAQVEFFAGQICDATKSGNTDFFNLLNLEFGLRLTIDEKQLKRDGQTMDQAIKQNEVMLKQIIETSGNDSPKAEKCVIESAVALECPDLYEKIEARSPNVTYHKIKETGNKMNIEVCGMVSLTTTTPMPGGGADEKKADFAAARINGKWSIIMMMPPPPKETKGDSEKK